MVHQCISKPVERDSPKSSSELSTKPKRIDLKTALVSFLGGCFFVLLIIIIISLVILHKTRTLPNNSNSTTEIQSDVNRIEIQQYRSDWSIIIRLYRGPIIMIFLIFLLGFNVR